MQGYLLLCVNNAGAVTMTMYGIRDDAFAAAQRYIAAGTYVQCAVIEAALFQ